MNYGTSFVHPTVQVFFLIKTMVHKILQFQSKGAIRKDFKLGLALVNKKRICTRLINKKLEKIAPTFSRTWSSITSEHDIGEDFEEVVSND
jgi:hypothetical protein